MSDFLEDLEKHILKANRGHYYQGEEVFEPIDYMRSQGWLKHFAMGNVIKYVTRFQQTENKDDLLKAANYIRMLYEG